MLTIELLLCFMFLIFVYKYKTNIIKTYNDYRAINELVASKFSNKCMIQYKTINIIVESWKLRLWQKLNRSIRKISKSIFEVNFEIEGKKYFFIIKKQNGPNSIVKIENSKKNNITNNILKYIGPNKDFYNFLNLLTAEQIGINKNEELTVYYNNGNKKIFKSSECLYKMALK